ncbi:hypothetical protein, partial [Vibrio sp. 10N.237.312.B06]|uniref:hypothetical protein n=1 Tax=Vibrio sp. 10N.237.312.B06 TaxID=3229974 RepID=UPI00354DB3BA
SYSLIANLVKSLTNFCPEACYAAMLWDKSALAKSHFPLNLHLFKPCKVRFFENKEEELRGVV